MSNYQEVGILEDLGRRYNRNSPDYLERKLEGQIPVFVYGTLRQGFSNHGLLKDLPYLGRGVSAIEKFEMREPHHGGFPLLFENGQRTNSANVMSGKVHGEVYVVDPLTLLELDRLEGNGYMYARSKQWITLRDQHTCTSRAAGRNNPVEKIRYELQRYSNQSRSDSEVCRLCAE